VFGSDGNLYVSIYNHGKISRYNGVTGAYMGDLDTLNLGSLQNPVWLMSGPEGYLYAGSVGGAVKRYNVTTGAFIDDFATGGGLTNPGGMAFGPDGNLYVNHGTTNSVKRYDGVTGTYMDDFIPSGSGGLNYNQDIAFWPPPSFTPKPPVTVSGTVTLQGLVPTAPAQPLVFTFRSGAGRDMVYTADVLSGGTFSFKRLPARHYTLHVQGSRYLAANVSVDATNGDVSNVSVTLLTGDINSDNKIGIADLGLLADAFHSTSSNGNWNPYADLNGDGQVDVTDLGLLADNFGRKGDL
jgi:hypothetical protein